MLIEVEGKIIVGKEERAPYRCPECRRFFRAEKAEKIRCPYCQKLSKEKDLKCEWIATIEARILVPA